MPEKFLEKTIFSQILGKCEKIGGY